MVPLRPLSIVHVLAPGWYGGLESVVATLATGQAEADERVVIAPVFSEAAADHPFVHKLGALGLEVQPVEVGVRDYHGERVAISSILRAQSADVLHTHGYRPDVIDAPVARRLGVRSVSTVHGRTQKGWKSWLYNKIQERALRSIDAVVAVSTKLESELLAAGIQPDRLRCVPNCWRPRQPFIDSREARSALSLPPDVPVVGWVGRFSREKAPDLMLRAFAACGIPEARLSLVGSGPLEDGCRSLAGALGIQDRVTWHGVVSDVSKYLRAFDVLALTSWTEGTPMILLEAMAAEVPVVVTRVGGIPEVVSTEEARLVEPGEVRSIGVAVADVLTDRTGAAARALAARRRFDVEFSVDDWVRRYRAIYVPGEAPLA